LHPEGELYAWHERGEPAEVPGEQLLRGATLIAITAALARLHPPFTEEAKEARQEYRLVVLGVLARALPEVSANNAWLAILHAVRDPKAREREHWMVDTQKRIRAGDAVPGIPKLKEIIGDKRLGAILYWISEVNPQAPATKSRATVQSDWQEPQPLGAELPAVQSLDASLLPSSLRPFIEDISERMQTPIDYAAITSVAALAGSVNRRAFIQPKLQDTGWSVVPNLWGAIVAPPGFMKSPLLRAVTMPLLRIEELWREEHRQDAENFETAREEAELRHQAWKEEYKAAMKKGDAAPIQPDKSLQRPAQKRLVLTDATFERLHEILAENPAGVLVVRDELTGWLADLEKPGRESERGFYLQAWNGDSSFTVDRIGRGSVYVPSVCVSLLGNIQPARLRWFFSDAIHGGPGDDGLFQRFQLLVWPDAPRSWKLVDRPPNAIAANRAERVYRGLVALSADCPVSNEEARAGIDRAAPSPRYTSTEASPTCPKCGAACVNKCSGQWRCGQCASVVDRKRTGDSVCLASSEWPNCWTQLANQRP
jgi:hypothetical protein